MSRITFALDNAKLWFRVNFQQAKDKYKTRIKEIDEDA